MPRRLCYGPRRHYIFELFVRLCVRSCRLAGSFSDRLTHFVCTNNAAFAKGNTDTTHHYSWLSWTHSTVAGNTQRNVFYKRNTDCSPSCLNYLLLEQRDFVTKLRRAQTNTNLIELELNDSETPVFRTVYPISVASSYSFTIFLCFMSNLYLYFYCNCVNPACIAATLNKRFRFWFWYRNWRVAF